MNPQLLEDCSTNRTNRDSTDMKELAYMRGALMALLIGYMALPSIAQVIDVEPEVSAEEDYFLANVNSMSYPAGPPSAVDDSRTTYVDVPVTIPVLSNDTGDIDPATTKKLTDPTNGSAVKNPDNTFTYSPNPNFIGVDTFTYETCNADSSLCSTATVTVTILPPPAATDDVSTTPGNTPVNIPVLSNDTGDITPSTIIKLTDPPNGAIIKNPDNTFTYTPNPGFSGVDTFTYQVCNSDSTVCTSATVTVTVLPLPQANNDVVDTSIDTPVTIPVLANDVGSYKPDTTKKLTDPTNGSVVKNPDNTFTYTPNPGFSGTDTFTYEICDINGVNCSPATVLIYIENAPSMLPSFFPTQVPSAQPSLSRCCNTSPLNWRLRLTEVATSVSGTILPGTPQRQALDWMINEDNYCECDADSCKIYERYSLAVFYFSTVGDSWGKCSKPDLTNPAAIDAANAACDIRTTPIPRALEIPSGLEPEGTDAWLTPVDACKWAGIVCRTVSGCADRIEFGKFYHLFGDEF